MMKVLRAGFVAIYSTITLCGQKYISALQLEFPVPFSARYHTHCDFVACSVKEMSHGIKLIFHLHNIATAVFNLGCTDNTQ